MCRFFHVVLFQGEAFAVVNGCFCGAFKNPGVWRERALLVLFDFGDDGRYVDPFLVCPIGVVGVFGEAMEVEVNVLTCSGVGYR